MMETEELRVEFLEVLRQKTGAGTLRWRPFKWAGTGSIVPYKAEIGEGFVVWIGSTVGESSDDLECRVMEQWPSTNGLCDEEVYRCVPATATETAAMRKLYEEVGWSSQISLRALIHRIQEYDPRPSHAEESGGHAS